MNRRLLLRCSLLSVLLLAACAPAPRQEEAPPQEGAMPIVPVDESTPPVEEKSVIEEPVSEEPAVEEPAPEERVTEDAGGDGGVTSLPPRVIQVLTENWQFTPSTITVKRGQKVTLQIQGVSGTHGFAVPELGINVPVPPGQTVTVDLPTDRIGSFPLFCSIPCGQGHVDMRGPGYKIVVEP